MHIQRAQIFQNPIATEGSPKHTRKIWYILAFENNFLYNKCACTAKQISFPQEKEKKQTWAFILKGIYINIQIFHI